LDQKIVLGFREIGTGQRFSAPERSRLRRAGLL